MPKETRGRKVEVYALAEGHDRVDRLKYVRTKAGMSQQNMADKIGTPMRTYCKIEAGERELKACELATILADSGIDANWFLFGEGQKEL